MQRAPHLEFSCLECQAPVAFCLFEIEDAPIQCPHCSKPYRFASEILQKLRKFEALCRTIHDCEEILGDTSVAIDVGSCHVKVPFRLLLTRLGSVMTLKLGEKTLEICFRTEPLADLAPATPTLARSR